jgi:hypothetical protein
MTPASLSTLEPEMAEPQSKGAKPATAAQLWRANTLGLLTILDEPAAPIPNVILKEVLGEAARLGLWSPAHGVRGPVRSG